MFRIYQSTNAQQAKDYYTEALAREDYYTQGRDITGNWGGKAAALLGLSGQVSREPFASLCDNISPASGERLTPRTRDDRTVGYDLSFHAPKGISVLHALTGDERIVQAMRDAVHETMTELEANTQTRVRLPGPDGKPRSENRHSGNLAWGEFVHFTTRPIDGIPDPHLHIHCYIFNATHDPEEARWKAAQFRAIVQDHPYFEAGFHSRFAANLESIGYDISRNPEGWDLLGITREIVEKFSRRTAEIEAVAKQRGITDPVEKATLGARTRSKKDKGLSPDGLATKWMERLSEDEAEWLHGVTQQPGLALEPAESIEPFGLDRQRVNAAEAIDHALEHVFARRSVESERRLLAEALRFGLQDVTAEQVAEELRSRPECLSRDIDGIRWWTTRAIQAEELEVLRFAVEGKGTCVPLGPGIGGRSGEPYEVGSLSLEEGVELNAVQHGAVEQLLSSRDRVLLLRGGAGTGKTTLLKEVAEGVRQGGGEIHAFAVTTDASRKVLREAGFDRAQPLKQLLVSKQLQEQVAGKVILVDEAGMVGTRTMRELVRVAEAKGARILLAGDTKQHRPVERGDAMGLLQRQAGINAAEVDEIIRQQGMYKQAVEALDKGELTRSVRLLDDLGAIREIEGDDRHQALADRYMEAVKNGKSAIVVAPTHAEGRDVTQAIRERLREAGQITEEERSFTRLHDLQWTEAEKADAHKYTSGLMIQYHQHCPGVPQRDIPPAPAGLKAEIVGIDAEARFITTRDAAGTLRPLHMDTPDRFGVYEPREVSIAEGDKLRITKNARTIEGKHRLDNGSEYTVAGFTEEGHITLANRGNWTVSKDMGHVNHAYCMTPQAAQGKSVDVCLGALSAAGLRASSIEQLYVIASRGKERVELLTDQREALIDAIASEDTQRSATELLARKQEHARETMKRLAERAREVQRMKAEEHRRQTQERARARGHDRSRSSISDRNITHDRHRDRGERER